MKIQEAAFHARKPGRNAGRADLKRLFKHAVIWSLNRRWIPLRVRQRLLFGLIAFTDWLSFGRWFVLGGASKGNTTENNILKLVFNAIAWANMADNAAASPFTNLYVSLHTADPGEAGTQTTSEAAYTSYARVAVARTSGGWTVTANSVSPAAQIVFPEGTGGSGTATYGGIGTAVSGTGELLYSGALDTPIVMGNTLTPILKTTSTVTED